jgi:FAD/FMN-containing dehydrogenase
MTADHAAPLADLRAVAPSLDGRLVQPADPEWDAARAVWNGMIDRQPLAVLQCASPQDVARGIGVAREHGVALAVRGGGHNVAGNSTIDGGLVLDLSPMRRVEIDPAARRVRVGGGATLRDLDVASQARALVVPAGVVSSTGVGGLTLGGGMGWTTRGFGLSIDALTGAELVTADGRQVRASASEHPDLFWGVRGGGGNFGVVTTFEFEARPLGPEVFAGATYHVRERWEDALRVYAEWAPTIPDELTTIVTWMTPPDEWLPEHLQGQPMLLLSFCWTGAHPEDGERAVADLVRESRPDHVAAEPTPWLDLQSSADEGFPKGVRAYFKSVFLERLDEGAIATLCEHAARRQSPLAGTDIHQLGGAYARVPADATAYGHRHQPYILNVWGVWEDAADDADQIAWVREFVAAMRPWATGGAYVNFQGRDDPAEVAAQAREAYPPGTWERLVAVKDAWDPTNLFRPNHNVTPSRP